MAKQPNILMIVSDEERGNGWLAGKTDYELVNLAHDRRRSDELRENFARLLHIEKAELG